MPSPVTTSPVSPSEVEASGLAPADRALLAGADAVAVAVLAGATDDAGGASLELGPGAAGLAESLDVPDLLDLLTASGATGEPGEVVAVPVAGADDAEEGVAPLRLLLVGVGSGTTTDLRRAGAALAKQVRSAARVVSSVSAVADDDGQTAFVEGLFLGAFAFSMRREAPQHPPAERVVLALGSADALAPAVARAHATWRARTWATTPSNVKSPQWLADEAVDTADAAGLTTTVLDEGELQRQGFGGLLGVGQGSATPPRLVRLDYTPSRAVAGTRKPAHVVLVGKGITFDSGGLSIKPAASMATMKRDMTGAAVVAAVLAALPAVGCPVRVTGLLPLAENAVSGSAMRPGDVLTHVGGRTTEVTNTDAEGRLVLADALAYAVAELAPDALVDVATLTGGVKVALGQHLGGLFTDDDALAEALERAGARSGEPLWRLPLAREYAAKLASKIADADNAPGGPPAITAALFLEPFTGGLPWAHLDIASVGDAPKDAHEWTEGPTGFGARLLLDWLAGPDPLAGVGAS